MQLHEKFGIKEEVIVCGKFNNHISFDGLNTNYLSKPRRIAVDNPNKIKKTNYTPISTNGSEVLHQGVIWKVEDFLNTISENGRRLIVLTLKEYLLILSKTSLLNISVSVFEINYPIFKNIKYSSTLNVNINTLSKLLNKLEYLNIKSTTFARDQTLNHLHSVGRKVRFKNSFDHFFFFAYKDGYQEVFKLKEERPNRVIIAFDFNSMFADCMKGDFCEPRSIHHKTFADYSIDPAQLSEGIYRVVLKGAKDGFFLKHHPFLYKRLGKSSYFMLNQGDSVEIVLYKNEINYFKKFFQEIHIKEGFCSKTTIPHPLLNKALSLYSRRQYFKQRGDDVMENYCKISMQLMHSSTNQKVFKKKHFESLDATLSFLSSEFLLNLPEETSLEDINDFLRKSKYFRLKKYERGVMLDYLNIKADSLLFSFSSKIIANARVKLLETIEKFIEHNTVEICYANIDSIHISIDSSEVDSFLNVHKELISDDLGCLKIQAIADQGYWFDIGRYWLKKNGKVVLFKNKSFNYKGAKNEFISKRKVYSLTRSKAFCHFDYFFVNLDNTFSYSKRVKQTSSEQSIVFERYSFTEVKSSETANHTEANELMKSKKLKVDLFRYISQPILLPNTSKAAVAS